MAAYISISQKRRSNGHADTYRNIFKFFSSVNLSPGLNRNQGTGKLGKLVSSILQKTKHFTVMLQMSHKREKRIPYCGRVILLKAVFSAKMSKCLLGHSHRSTREKKNSQYLHWAAVAKMENINNGLNLWTHRLLHEVNHKLLTIPAVCKEVLTFPKNVLPGHSERVKLKVQSKKQKHLKVQKSLQKNFMSVLCAGARTKVKFKHQVLLLQAWTLDTAQSLAALTAQTGHAGRTGGAGPQLWAAAHSLTELGQPAAIC